MSTLTAKSSDKQPAYGRPRLLTHDEILAAAVKVGLDGLTMKKLSTALNVGTATLYQYFDSRKALMRAAAVYSLSDVPLPVDTGQHWSVLSREYVQSLKTLLSDNPGFMNSFHHTDYGFEVHFKLVEPFLTAMRSRGLAPEPAMALFNMIGLIAYGGAVEEVRQREFEYQDETMSVVARRQFARLDASEFPLMKEALGEFTLPSEDKTFVLMKAAFQSFARENNLDETLFEEVK